MHDVVNKTFKNNDAKEIFVWILPYINFAPKEKQSSIL